MNSNNSSLFRLSSLLRAPLHHSRQMGSHFSLHHLPHCLGQIFALFAPPVISRMQALKVG